MDKLSKFPLQAAGFADAPDETVIVAWPGWSLTVGDVRAARTAPQHSVTERASIGDDHKFQRLLVDFGSARFQDVQTTRDRLIAYIDSRAALAIPASTAASEQQANLSDTKELIDYCDKWCGKVPQDMIAKARIELAHPYTKGQ